MKASLSKLGDQATIVMGQSPLGESYNKDGKGAPLLNGPTEFGPLHPTEKQWTIKPTKFCQPGDILFCVRGATAGRLNVADKEYCLGRGLAAIRGESRKLDNGFLLHVLTNGYAKFQARGVGSTFINISKEELANFEVPEFPVAEQRRIAAILDKANSLREKRRQAIAKLDALLKSVCVEMFGDPVTNPKGWPKESLERVSSKITDAEHLNPVFAPEGVPMIMAGDVLSTGVSFDDIKFIRPQDYEKFSRKCHPQRRDILIVSRGATIGRCTIVDTDRNFSLMGSVILVKPNREKVSPEYLSVFLAHPASQQRLYKTSSASAQQAIYISHVKNLEVIVPPLSLQKNFTSFYGKHASLKQDLIKSAQRTDLLFQSLQHRAFSGEPFADQLVVAPSPAEIVQHV